MFVTKESFSQLKELLDQFNEIHNSPHSFSFYDRKVSWGEKENGTLRCSDHWNYTTEHDDHVHSVTNIEVKEGNWAIGRYNDGVYEILWQSDIDYHNEKYMQLVKETEQNDLENIDHAVEMLSVTSSSFEPNKIINRDWEVSIWAGTNKAVVSKDFRIYLSK